MATSNTFSITAGVTSFACDFGATDKETIVLTISSTGAVISSNDYSVLGVAASATAGDITIEWDDAGDYVGETLIISKFTEIDTGSPSDAMLVDFTSSGTTNPTNIQNEFAHLYDIIGQITGGTAVGTYDIADIGTLIARLNDLADDIFTTTTNSGTPAIWDGANTLSIGGDTNVQSILTTHESRLDAAETLLGFDTGPQLTDDVVGSVVTLQSNVGALLAAAGFANPYTVTAANVSIADAGGYISGATVEAALQEMGVAKQRLWTMANAARLDHVQTLSTTADANCIAINGQYGVIGAVGGSDGIWRSSNYGRSWTIDTSLDAILSNVYGLAFNTNGSVLVAAGSAVGANELAYSSDYGNTWTGVGTPSATQREVCWSGSLFVSVGDSGTIYTSSDGATWTARTADGTPANITFYDVTWSSTLSLFIAVGTDTTTSNHIEIQTSPDGATWTARAAAATSEVRLNNVAEIDFGSTTYIVAVGTAGEIQYSADAITWTAHAQSNVSSNDFVSVCQVPAAALIGDSALKMSLVTSITRASSTRYPEDGTAPGATAGNIFVVYDEVWGILAAGTNGLIWQSFTGSFA